jgi:hypothetical protein
MPLDLNHVAAHLTPFEAESGIAASSPKHELRATVDWII